MGEWLVPKVNQDPALQKLSWSAARLLHTLDVESLVQTNSIEVQEVKLPNDPLVQKICTAALKSQDIYQRYVDLVDYDHETKYPSLVLLDDALSTRWLEAGQLVGFAPFSQEFLVSLSTLRDDFYQLSRGEKLNDGTTSLAELDAKLTAAIFQKLVEVNRQCRWFNPNTHIFGTSTTQYDGIDNFGNSEFLEATPTFDKITLYRASSANPVPKFIRNTSVFNKKEVVAFNAVAQDAINHLVRSIEFQERINKNAGEDVKKVLAAMQDNDAIKEQGLLDEPDSTNELLRSFFVSTPVEIYTPPSYIDVFGNMPTQEQTYSVYVNALGSAIFPWKAIRDENESKTRNLKQIGINIQGLLGIYNDRYKDGVQIPVALRENTNFAIRWLNIDHTKASRLNTLLGTYSAPNVIGQSSNLRRQEMLEIEKILTEIVLTQVL